MGQYEKHLLDSYEQQYGKRPALWLRFIDDVFVVWQGTAAEFNHFIQYCDQFSGSKEYKSNLQDIFRTIQVDCFPGHNGIYQ